MSNYVFMAASIDGFIARSDGSMDWLTGISNPDNNDYGYNEFIGHIDAIVMGRNTLEFVRGMDVWPYDKPVFVLSSTLKPFTDDAGRFTIVNAGPGELVSELKKQGCDNLYIDGGKTIQSFLAEDLIEELIITRIPILLGSGIPLFGYISKEIRFNHIDTIIYRNGLVTSRYRRK